MTHLSRKIEEQIPHQVRPVLDQLALTGKSVYVFGGVVRDIALSLSPKDWDIMTDLSPKEIEMLFPEAVCI